MTRLKAIFEELVVKLGNSHIVASKKWEEISQIYNSSNRFYHNIIHLESMFTELEKVKGVIKDWDSTLFSLFYHDIIYDSTKTDNEERSSKYAKRELLSFNVSIEQIEKVQQTILATKSHIIQNDHDINIFLDADISILGTSQEVYEKYIQNIRLEYLVYPSFVFNQGRLKVIEHFLTQDTIYKTDLFKNQYEISALTNLRDELKKLNRINQTFNRANTKEYVKYLEWDGDLCEFFYNSAKLLDQTENIEKIVYYPGWFDSGYYRFKYKGTALHLEYDGMLGTFLRTESNATEKEKSHAEEIFLKLIDVRLSNDDINRVREFYIKKNTINNV